ncbi:MAG TPA: LPS assembly lipoprotein LptE [Caulobacteraceae bacterium]|jgi:LPS-assembly lipoprotein
MPARALTAALLAATAIALSACGFTPLYATPGVTPNLASIEVVTPEGRTGHLLAEQLREELAVGAERAPAYRLNLAVDEKRYARGLQVEDVASWYELSVRVSYSLVEIATGQTVAAGVAPVSVSYNAVRDPYAGITAQQDGQERAAREAATRLRLELSRYFASRGAEPRPSTGSG